MDSIAERTLATKQNGAADRLKLVPDELRERKQWVLWKNAQRAGEATKIPFQVNGKPASSTDKNTWSTFDDATAACERGGYAGLGYVFSSDDPYVGIDLDGCRAPGQRAETWAKELVEKFDSYAEISPSESGVKIWVRGKLERARRTDALDFEQVADKKPGIELYSQGRYFTVTGKQVWGNGCVSDAQAALDEVVATYWPAPTYPAAESPVDDRARAYVAKMDPAISGQRGHDKAFAVACVLVLGFGLTPDEAMPLMREYSERCEPPWSERELRHKVESAAQQPGERNYLRDARPEQWGSIRLPDYNAAAVDSCDLAQSHERTDAANARRLVERYGDRIRWCDPWQKWLVWDGARWKIDDERRADELAKQAAESLWQALAEAAARADGKGMGEPMRSVRASNPRKGVSDSQALARSEPGVPVLPAALDRDPWLLNVKNGTLDLRTFELTEHNRADLITKVAPVTYDPGAKCPRWYEFIQRVTNNNKRLADFLRRLAGYALTGCVGEHVLPLHHGTGANGKSTFVGIMLDLLGENYSLKAPSDLLLAKRGEHPTALASLHGKRLAVCSEVDGERRLAESLAKELTGGDKITARRMREDFWQFEPTHKIWLVGNHRPTVRGTDHGIWRRIKLVPFTVTIPEAEQDPGLPEKLRSELPGILNWCLLGCQEWQQDGLAPPPEVAAATGEYRDDMDLIGKFIEERTFAADGASIKASDLFLWYKAWCEDTGERPVSSTAFGSRLNERGIAKKRKTGGWHRLGIAISGIRNEQ